MNKENPDLSESSLYEQRLGNPNGKATLRFLTVAFAVLCFIVLPFVLYCRATYTRVVVDGDSMNNTLYDGDTLYVNRRKSADYADIVVLDVTNYPESHFSGRYIIKRLIAKEGDVLYCSQGQIYIQYANTDEFTKLPEEYIWFSPEYAVTRGDFAQVTVEAGEVFVLGDNRLNSYDSGEVGCFRVEDVYGVVPDWAYALKNVFTP